MHTHRVIIGSLWKLQTMNIIMVLRLWVLELRVWVKMLVDARAHVCVCIAINKCMYTQWAWGWRWVKSFMFIRQKKRTAWFLAWQPCFSSLVEKVLWTEAELLNHVGLSVWSYQYRQLHKVRGIKVLGVHCRPGLLQDVPSLLEEGAEGVFHLAKTWERSGRKE